MRVYHVVRQFWPSIGGLEDVVEHLAREQMACGLTVKVITLNRIFAEPQRQLAACESRAELEIVRLPFRGSPRYPLAPQLISVIGDADLLHVHAIDFFFDFLALTRILHGKPLLATTHGGFFHTSAHARLKRIWFNAITPRSLRAYDAVVACSAADYALFAPIAANNLHRIDNGVDIEKFAGCSSPSPVKRLATIGRYSSNKRLDHLLDMMVKLVGLDSAWQMDVVGTPSDWSLARLQAEVAARQLDAHVHLAVDADNKQAAAILAGASLFVSASEHEGFGLAVIEALSAGLIPVLHGNMAFRALQARCDLIRIVDFADAGCAAATIEKTFAELRQDAHGMRAAAQKAAQAFAWPRVADLYLDLYRDVLHRDALSREIFGAKHRHRSPG